MDPRKIATPLGRITDTPVVGYRLNRAEVTATVRSRVAYPVRAWRG